MIGGVPCPQCDGTGHGAYNDPEDDWLPLFKIVRFHFEGENEVVKHGLTLYEAQQWCRRDDTHGDGWFDGYTEE